jgi:hypothetical protein
MFANALADGLRPEMNTDNDYVFTMDPADGPDE